MEGHELLEDVESNWELWLPVFLTHVPFDPMDYPLHEGGFAGAKGEVVINMHGVKVGDVGFNHLCLE